MKSFTQEVPAPLVAPQALLVQPLAGGPPRLVVEEGEGLGEGRGLHPSPTRPWARRPWTQVSHNVFYILV